MTTTTTGQTTRDHVVADLTGDSPWYRATKGRWTQGLQEAKRYSAEDARILALGNGHHAIKVDY